MSETLEATLAERGARYGDFSDHAAICDSLLAVLERQSKWPALKAHQRQSLRVICDKIARIMNGDPNYADSWHDIQGYAKLSEDRCTPQPTPTVERQ